MLNDLSFLAIDFETASSTQRGSACALGFALVESGLVVRTGKSLIDPQLPPAEWSGMNIGIHGIRPDAVRGAPPFFKAWEQMLSTARGFPIVAHNASFDMSVLRAEHERAQVPISGYRYACSVQLARRTWPDVASAALPNLADYLGIDLDHHDPASDARACALITLAAVRELSASSLDAALSASGLCWGEVLAANDWIPCGGGGGRDIVARVGSNPNPNHPFFGKVVVFTGALGSMTRDTAEAYVATIGGVPGPSVTKRTRFVVVGGFRDAAAIAAAPPTSSKHERALKLLALGADIRLLAEGEFLSLL
jgi:DNA polymerase-3 subunit epsilon